MRKTLVAPVAILGSCLIFVLNLLAAAPDLDSLDWSVMASRNLSANPPTGDAVKAFMSKLDGPGPQYPLGICYARFADLEHSGTLSLVVSEGDGRFCHLFVVDKSAPSLEEYSFDLAHGADGPEIQDLARNGKLELIVPTDLTAYMGGDHCIAQWPVVYAWTGNGYKDVSGRYRAYYEQQLTLLKKDITATEARNAQPDQQIVSQGPVFPPQANRSERAKQQSSTQSSVAVASGNQAPGYGPSASFRGPAVPLSTPQPSAAPQLERYGLDCTKAEAAKIERLLGISRDAGMGDAVKWANSDNPVDREFATDILDDIATREALEYLKTLAHDPNRQVADSAKISLKHVGPTVNAVERESIPDYAGNPAASAR
jgi:hypothetical protein